MYTVYAVLWANKDACMLARSFRLWASGSLRDESVRQNGPTYLKTNMFPNGPSIVSLHFEGWTVKVQVKNAKMSKSFFFSRNSAVYDPPLQFGLSSENSVATPGRACLLWLALQIYLLA